MQDILAVDLSAAMLEVLQKKYGASQSTLGNDAGTLALLTATGASCIKHFYCTWCALHPPWHQQDCSSKVFGLGQVTSLTYPITLVGGLMRFTSMPEALKYVTVPLGQRIVSSFTRPTLLAAVCPHFWDFLGDPALQLQDK
eukprot:1161851-Pelagomonas_calceolata.AAC.4